MVTRKREKSKEKREISRQKRTVSRLGGYMQIKKVYFVYKIQRGKKGEKVNEISNTKALVVVQIRGKKS